jgi:glycosyltransferase involved in cell wall biosynthesis
VRFTVAVTGPPPSVTCARRLLAHPHLALVHRPYRLEWMPEADLDVARTGGWLLDLAARVRPDIVHVNGYAHAALPFGVPAIVVAHSCVCSWFTAVKEMAAPVEWRAYRARVAAGLQAAAAVVVPTRTMRAALEHEHGYADALIVPNGLPPRRRPAVAPAKEPIVLAAGRLWDEAKGLAVLDAAAAGAAWPVYAAGDLHRPDGAVDAPRHMHALGTLEPDAMQAWMDRAGIFAHPARYEPFGLAPLEAALSRCAILASDIPTFREIWGENAVYFRNNDRECLEAALFKLCADPAAIKAYGGLALAHARQHYSSSRMTEDYLQLYRSLIPAGVVAA